MVKKKGGRVLRSIINPLCSGYKYIDFLNDYSLSAKRLSLVDDYRGLRKGVYTSKTLSTSLGVSVNIVEKFRSKHKDYSVEKVIDYFLDDYDSSFRKIGKYTLSEYYRGIKPFTSISELADQLGVSKGSIYNHTKKGDKTIYELIDYMLDEYKEFNIYLLKEEYRGVKPGKYLSNIANQLNVPIEVLNNYVKRRKVSAEKVIDYILDEYNINGLKSGKKKYILSEEYRGVKPCNSLVEISKQLNVNEKVLRHYTSGKNVEVYEIIDYLLDTYRGRKSILHEGNRGVESC